MQQNSIYDVHMNKSMKMSKNVAYETTIIEAKSQTYENVQFTDIVNVQCPDIVNCNDES